jgi:hypothetical protein
MKGREKVGREGGRREAEREKGKTGGLGKCVDPKVKNSVRDRKMK